MGENVWFEGGDGVEGLRERVALCGVWWGGGEEGGNICGIMRFEEWEFGFGERGKYVLGFEVEVEVEEEGRRWRRFQRN